MSPSKPNCAGAEIRLDAVSVQLGKSQIVNDIDLRVGPGEFVCLLGPSGCGKSTLLNVVAGFVAATSGSVAIGNSPVIGPSADHGVVFQSTEALFPWLTVRENVEYGLRMRGVQRRNRIEPVDRFLRLVGLTHAAHRLPNELSGGMRQRVQLARVLVNDPSVVLMDEPFGALDAQTREIMQVELHRVWRATSPTILFITHDIWEAIILGDRIVTMTAGPNAKLKTDVRIDLPHPRDTTAPAAIELYRHLREDIAFEVRRTLQYSEVSPESAHE